MLQDIARASSLHELWRENKARKQRQWYGRWMVRLQQGRLANIPVLTREAMKEELAKFEVEEYLCSESGVVDAVHFLYKHESR